MKTVILFLAYAAIFSVCSGVAVKSAAGSDDAFQLRRDISTTPLNSYSLNGNFVQLSCAVANATSSRVQWIEYNTDIDGSIISDNHAISPAHPYYARYKIINTTVNTFNLLIDPIVFGEDGGHYMCKDTQAILPATTNASAQLIVLASNSNCSTVIPSTGHVLEGYNYTVECYLSYDGGVPPHIFWSGYDVSRSSLVQTADSVWSIVFFTAHRNMSNSRYSAKTNFTQQGFQGIPGYASNAPSYSFTYSTVALTVNWGPKNTYIVPIQPSYAIGNFITCYSDAFPPPSYEWQNLDTGETWFTQGIQFTANHVGTTTFRCQALNRIDGYTYTDDTFLDATVIAPVTTTKPTIPATTPTPPAEGVCNNPTGTWTCAETAEQICITVDVTANGMIQGFYKPPGKNYFIEMIGQTDLDSFDELGFSAILPKDEGLTVYAGECHNCYGVEQLIMSSITRSAAQMVECDVAGPVKRNVQTVYKRSSGSCYGLREGATGAEIHNFVVQSQIAAGIFPTV